MVRSVGIDPGEDTAKVVELDGTYRKTRLLRVHVAPVAVPASDIQGRADAVAAIAREAIDTGMKGEPLLGHPCREAVLRVLDLPFKGHEQIRKVVKAEAEGEIHGYVVDDMVVDFHEIGEGTAGGTRLLVAAVPKAGLRAQLDALAGNSIEPEHIDLDTMALWRAAHWAGAFAAEDEAAPVPMGASVVTAVVEIGARSVKVLLVEGENLVDMRVIRVGDATVGDGLANRHGIDPSRGHELALEVLRSGRDVEFALEEELPDAVDDEEGAAAEAVAAPTMRQVVISHAETEAAHTAYLQRLARELVRYLTSVTKAATIRAVWTTGMGCRAPGVTEMLNEVFGVEARELDVLANLQHDLEPEEVEALGPHLATAIGLALTKLGGPEGFDLRQEDLVVQRGFERIKFPLAILCMVALLALVFYSAKLSAELRNLELQIGKTYIDPKKPNGTPQFHGMLHSVLSGKWFENGSQFRIEDTKGKDYTYKNLIEDLAAAPVHKRLLMVRDKLRLVADQKQKNSGIYEDVSLESGLAVLVRFAQIMKTVEPQLGRYLMLKLSLNMKAPNRKLEFLVAFRGDDFRDRMNALQLALEADYEDPKSPFEKPSTRAESSKEEPFRDYAETNVPGSYYKITLRVKDSFMPFGQ
ncbi:MAG: pilus assembly protein PilM [Planctomycetes bacterium]|nr:pilus assembly protein PilM [Planctomycetota bacterium]